jgi:hypothetical protein
MVVRDPAVGPSRRELDVKQAEEDEEDAARVRASYLDLSRV